MNGGDEVMKWTEQGVLSFLEILLIANPQVQNLQSRVPSPESWVPESLIQRATPRFGTRGGTQDQGPRTSDSGLGISD